MELQRNESCEAEIFIALTRGHEEFLQAWRMSKIPLEDNMARTFWNTWPEAALPCKKSLMLPAQAK